jgi:hypothetical protein
MIDYTPGTQINVKIPCSNCENGFVSIDNPGDVIKAERRGYCPKCHGDQWIQQWVSMETINRWLKEEE